MPMRRSRLFALPCASRASRVSSRSIGGRDPLLGRVGRLGRPGAAGSADRSVASACEGASYRGDDGRASAANRTNRCRRRYHVRMRTHAPRLVLGSIVLALVGACSTPAPSSSPAAPPTSVPTPSPDGVAADLAALLRALDTVHPNAFHGISREEFVVALEDYAQRLPNLSEAEAVVQLMRVNALLSREGRDGHQFTLPQPGHEAPVLPIRIYEFSEGVFVTDAAPGHEDIIGARITAIGDRPIDDVLELVEPLVPRDSPATVPTFRPVHLLRTEVLAGLGIIGEGPVGVEVERPDGSTRTATVE